MWNFYFHSLYLEALKLREKNLGMYLLFLFKFLSLIFVFSLNFALGPSSPLIADVLKSLGVLYTNQNYKQDPKKAGKLMQRAVRNRKKKE